MIFLKLFLIFSKIGIVNFGGGYAMLSLIYKEVVEDNGWISSAEFTDIVAISQSTPGPIGINAATYVGYSAVLADGYPAWAACLGAVLASVSVIWLPFVLMVCISRYMLKHKDSPIVKCVFSVLRPTIVGLIGAASILLMNKENFNSPSDDAYAFCISVLLFAATFVATKWFKVNPIRAIVVAGVVGLVVF